jgi:circadian clock protein KaiC
MNHPIEKLATHIPGFDLISKGGLPQGRTTLVSGAAGSAKTIFAAQFLAEGIRRGEGGVFVTFEEKPEELRQNLASFGWDIEAWEREGKWAFVDASPSLEEEDRFESGGFELGALLVRIEDAAKRVSAARLSLDSLGAIFNQLVPSRETRRELQRVVLGIKRLGVTAVITAERREGPVSQTEAVEEYVVDNVIVLRNALDEEKRRRTVEILKFRGADHQKGQFPFSVVAGKGMSVIPLSAMELKQPSTSVRVPSGSTELDAMCGGGFFRDSVVLISGATGTGKTLMGTSFIAQGLERGERALICAFEESREQLFRNARGWGYDFEAHEKKGNLRVVCEYPEAAPIEDHLLRIKDEIDEFQPQRVTVDSLSALERVGSAKSFREFVIGLTSFVKHHELTGLFTSTSSSLMGGSSITESHLSTITDSIILLRYVELQGQMRRGLTVLKMRGSMHDKEIREFTIDGAGMHIHNPFRNVSGILMGNPVHSAPREELQRLGVVFRDE